MVFTGIFTVVFLKRSLPRFKIIGILITVVGITSVGLSSAIFPVPGSNHHHGNQTMLTGATRTQMTVGEQMVYGYQHYTKGSYASSYSSSDSDTGGSMVLFGNALVIISQIMSAFQMVIEVRRFDHWSLVVF